MKARKVLCPECGNRMKRVQGYRKAWYNATHSYKTVYDCPGCGKRLKILAMDEDAFLLDRQELLDRMQSAEARILSLSQKLEEYRNKTNLSRFLMELDNLQKQLDRLRSRLREM